MIRGVRSHHSRKPRLNIAKMDDSRCRLFFAFDFCCVLMRPTQDFIQFEANRFSDAIVRHPILFALAGVSQQVKRDVNLGGNVSGGQKARVVELFRIASDPIG